MRRFAERVKIVRLAIYGCLLFVFLALGCAGKELAGSQDTEPITPEMLIVAKEKAEVKQPVKLTEDDNRRPVKLQKGQRLVVELEENPTTGYRWQFKEGGLPDVIAQVSSEFEPYSREPTRVGAGGKRTFVFEAVKYGNGMLKLVYCRPWQCELSAVKEFSISVNVEQPEEE
ncbi:MAG TPA: hypothetical protein ENF73_00165 [Proteobacteria bacterium]|nr:hypothetical protein [Pseudomonadota bacterium]